MGCGESFRKVTRFCDVVWSWNNIDGNWSCIANSSSVYYRLWCNSRIIRSNILGGYVNLTTALLLGSFIVTSYQSVKEQTDSSPCQTSTGYRTGPVGVAVHPRYLCPRAKYPMGKEYKLCKRGPQCGWKKFLHYYDLVYIETIGPRFINDSMAWKTKMNSEWDIWVATPQEESKHHKTYKTRRLNVWIISKVK